MMALILRSWFFMTRLLCITRLKGVEDVENVDYFIVSHTMDAIVIRFTFSSDTSSW